jgi:cytoskeletal protein CcmA (bactofilin family)
MASYSSEGSVIGPSTKVTGRVSGSGRLRIEGSIQGDVSITGPLELAEGASLDGNVSAESAEVGGTLTGDVTAEGSIAVRAGARLQGKLSGAAVSIEPGAAVSVVLDVDMDEILAPAKRGR